MTRHVQIIRLRLTDFRNYVSADLSPAGNVVLVGPNGAGKTNILEAVSLLSPGRGLRRAVYDDIAREGGPGGWAINATVESATGAIEIGTGIRVDINGHRERQRRIHIDKEQTKTSENLLEHLRVLWLTPSMDGLFRGPAGDRRRFLDRLVLAIEPGHGRQVTAFESAMRDRNRLLENPGADAAWLDAVEAAMAAPAIAVALARHELISCVNASIAETRDAASAFPWADIALAGDFEAQVVGRPASEAEDGYRTVLREGRARDRAAGRTLNGPHRTDLSVRHGPKDIAASKSSTGEQKALLLGLVLAHAGLVAAIAGMTPILLLDEIAAHLDADRRAALFEHITALGGQAWMTGTDAALFDAARQTATIYHVVDGGIHAI